MYQELIDAYIDGKQKEMLEDLKELVRIDSQRTESKDGMPFGEGPARALKCAGSIMEKYGLKVTNYDNYVVTGDYGEGEKALDILAHLDVVPVSEDWTVTKPFEPLVQGGRIYGRGTSDDKGPAIAALYAIRAIHELGIPLKYSVRLILGSDEECGSGDLAYYYAKEKEARFSFTPDADFPLINLEKARLHGTFEKTLKPEDVPCCVINFEAGDKVNVVPARACALIKGLGASRIAETIAACMQQTKTKISAADTPEGVQIRIKGRSAHGSLPENGISALTAMLTLLEKLPLSDCESTRLFHSLSALFPHGDTVGSALGVAMEDEVSGALSMNFGILRLRDGVLAGELDSRAPLCATDENLTEKVREKLAEIGLPLNEKHMRPAHYVPADSPLVVTLLDSYEKYFGKKGEAIGTGGGTYVHDLERGVAFGCMVEEVDNHMHGDDEFMEIDMMLRSAKIFADAIVKLCNMDAS